MRIAVWHNLPSGGGKRALYDHVGGLVGRGHHVESWCPSTADQKFLPIGELCREHVLDCDERPPRVRLLASARRPAAATYGRLAAMDRHCRQAAAAITAGGFDVLFANSCQFVRAAPIGRYVAGPKVLYLQEPYRWLYEAMPYPPFLGPQPPGRSALSPNHLGYRLRDHFDTLARRAQVRAEWEAAGAFDAVLVNSYFSREGVLRAYGRDAEVCYLGVDTSRLRDPGGPRDRFVIGVGAFVPEKNIGLVVDAVGRLPPPRPELVWVGNVAIPRHLDELTDRAAGRGVAFTPRVGVGHAELVGLLGRAAVMAYAPRLEPFGYAPLEAMACGCPVVAAAEGGVRETVVDGVTGVLAPPTADGLAAGLARVLGDPALADRLRASAARAVAERWALGPAVDRIEAALVRAVGGPR